MIRIHSQTQLTLDGFEAPFERSMDKNNRWVKLSACIPWDELANAYYQSFNASTGRPAKEGRLVIGAVIIKHKLKISDEETVAQIQENPYLQYFCGLKGFSIQAPFAPSLLVEIRKRIELQECMLILISLKISWSKKDIKRCQTSLTLIQPCLPKVSKVLCARDFIQA